VSERRNRGPRQVRFSLAGVRQPGAERSRSAEPTLQPSADVPSARPHPGGKRFVANKDLSVIRPSGDRTVEVPFPHFFRAPIVVNFGPVFSFRVSGRQRVVGRCLAAHFLVFKDLSCCPPGRFLIYPITKLPIYQIPNSKIYFLVNLSTLPYPSPCIPGHPTLA